MRNYPSDLQRHLANYKASRLGIEQPGTFRHGGKELQYGHILPAELRWLNILEQHRAEIKRYVDARPQIKLHKFFHHLNSSQAFALNAFFPFFEGAAAAELLAALGIGGTAVDWEVEHVADPREGTNVDVTWISEDGSRTYCEV